MSIKDLFEVREQGEANNPPVRIITKSEGGYASDLLDRTGRLQDGDEGLKISWAHGAYNLVRSGAAAGLEFCRNAIGKGSKGHRGYDNDQITHT